MADKKVAIIMGGGSGMGADSARRLAADGFNVAILSSSGKGEALASEFTRGLDVIASRETVTGASRFASGLGRHGDFGDI